MLSIFLPTSRKRALERRAGLGGLGHGEVAAEKGPHVSGQRALKDIRSKLKTGDCTDTYRYREHGEDRPPPLAQQGVDGISEIEAKPFQPLDPYP